MKMRFIIRNKCDFCVCVCVLPVVYEQDGMKVFSPEAGFVILQGSSLLRACRLWSVCIC